MVESIVLIPIFMQYGLFNLTYSFARLKCLVQDGKVCLSLLGTWSGPGWMPGKSTLLQVERHSS